MTLLALVLTLAHARDFSCSAENGSESVSIEGSYIVHAGQWRLRGHPAITVTDENGHRITGRRGPRVDFGAWRAGSTFVNDLFTVTLDTQNHGHGDLFILQHRVGGESRDVIDLSLARGDGLEIYARNYRDVSCEF